ncbi:hypothetical protein T459_29260 [Capsicum annuum]|uniref:Uncharacterized protein n=1 Tax=Capsicum annuum TaxID=4072 RepID=A0A2G2Y511_CAPAN|nr:hypothetical protein T459_29260 [Capsicum annuum]
MIVSVMEHPDAKLPDNITAYEAAVSACGKLCQFVSEGIYIYKYAFSASLILSRAWGRLCKCFGADFIPNLSVAMPIVLKSATLKNYLSVLDNADDSSGCRADIKYFVKRSFWKKKPRTVISYAALQPS